MYLLQKIVNVSGIKTVFFGILCVSLLEEHWRLQPRERRQSELWQW